MKKALLLFVLASACRLLLAQPAQDTIKVGMYVQNIFDLKFTENSCDATIWMWYLYKKEAMKPMETVEVANAKSVDNSLPATEKKGNVFWATQRVHATLIKDWDVRDFPFDDQRIDIELEDAISDSHQLVLLPDTANSAVNPYLHVDGWQIGKLSLQRVERKYHTNFGDPTATNNEGRFSVIHASLDIHRDAWPLFFKLFTGVYVAFFISWLAFFIEAEMIEPRFGLTVGGLFAAVGNKYIVDSVLPDSSSPSLADDVHMITFGFILATVLVSVVSMHFHLRQKGHHSKRLDSSARWVLLGLYVFVNMYMVVAAYIR
jgi:hypothetical protein